MFTNKLLYLQVEVAAAGGGVALVVSSQQPHLGIVPEVEGVNVMVLCLRCRDRDTGTTVLQTLHDV